MKFPHHPSFHYFQDGCLQGCLFSTQKEISFLNLSANSCELGPSKIVGCCCNGGLAPPMRHQIAKLVKDGLYTEAILLFGRQHSASITPTNYTFPYILKACAELKAISHGQILHAHLFKSGYTNNHSITDLTNMYLKLGFVDSAGKLFEEIPRPSVSLINVAISGLLYNGLNDVGFGLFKRYGVGDLRFDSITVASVVSACRDVASGAQLHCFVVKTGLELDMEASTSLMTMYFNCGELDSAVGLFGIVECKNVIFYNAYMSGLAKNGFPEMVLRVFKEMWSSTFENKPNVVTMISSLSVCGSGKCVRFGQQLHGLIVKVGFNLDVVVATGLVDMYSKCGSWQCAYSVFKEMGSNRNLLTWTSMIAGMMLNEKSENAIDLFAELQCEGLKANSVTWNSMISGFSHLGKMDEAFSFFRKMISYGVAPNAHCITSLLAACSSLYLLYYGRQIHAYVLRMKLFVDEFLATAIIDMYMKCGLPSLANNVFCQFQMNSCDPASWNAMIFGYGRNGKSEAAFDIFHQMLECRVKPNSATFSCLLFVCSQTGQVEEGFHIFRLMTAGYGLHPTSKQINILIDLLGRSGRLNEAFELLKAIDKPSASVFASLLRTSEHYSDLRLGEEIAERLLDLEPENPIPFVILSNIYAGQEKWRDVHKIRKLMDKKKLKKVPAISSIGPT